MSQASGWPVEKLPFLVLNLKLGQALRDIEAYFSGSSNAVLHEVLAQAYSLGASTALVEKRYVDADYRNEHSHFYSTTFREYPAFANRVHFFREAFEMEDLPPSPVDFSKYGYLGYAVLRPVHAAPVGRTILPPPLEADGAIVCVATHSVNLFGTTLQVIGMPFVAQDAQLGRCGQASMQMCSFYHHLAFSAPRQLPSDVAQMSTSRSSRFGRAVPSPGTDVGQLVEGLHALGIPPVVFDTSMEQSLEYEAVVCRYLNSRLPVMIVTPRHAFTLVGYRRQMNLDGNYDIQFLRHDDEKGPYQWVQSPWLEREYGLWSHILIPLPRKVYLDGELAEASGKERLLKTLKESLAPEDVDLLAEWDHPDRHLMLRSAVVHSNTLKGYLPTSGLPERMAALLQFLEMSRFIWLVELVERHGWGNSTDAAKAAETVRAFVVLDATDHVRDLQPIAWAVPSGLAVQRPGEEPYFFPGHSSPSHRSVVEILGDLISGRDEAGDVTLLLTNIENEDEPTPSPPNHGTPQVSENL